MICSCVVDYTRLNICVQHSVKPWGDVKALVYMSPVDK